MRKITAKELRFRGENWISRTKEHDLRVHCYRMKNITLSADEELIERARQIARDQHKTLNAAFREWLQTFTAQSGDEREFDALMRRLGHIGAGGPYSRDEMNER